jgi:hypothetical protein
MKICPKCEKPLEYILETFDGPKCAYCLTPITEKKEQQIDERGKNVKNNTD